MVVDMMVGLPLFQQHGSDINNELKSKSGKLPRGPFIIASTTTHQLVNLDASTMRRIKTNMIARQAEARGVGVKVGGQLRERVAGLGGMRGSLGGVPDKCRETVDAGVDFANGGGLLLRRDRNLCGLLAAFGGLTADAGEHIAGRLGFANAAFDLSCRSAWLER